MKTGDIIRALREQLDISQAELAKMLGVSRSAVSMYEANKRIPSTYVLKDLADIFNVDVDYLLGITSRTTVLPERLAYENKQRGPIVYKDADFTLYSPTRKLKSNAKEFIGPSLVSMTEARRPSREEILAWLDENVRLAAYSGQNYEDKDDEALYRLYCELKDESKKN